MKPIDEARLETDAVYRYRYLAEFTGFDETDIKTIHGSAGYLAPRISQIVEQTYAKLLAYDATARHFVPRQHGYDGPTPESLQALTADHAQIRFRKEHLTRYLMQLVGHAYNDKMVAYLDMTGKIHTPKAGSKQINVPLVQMNALMGLLADTLTATIMDLEIDLEQRLALLRAFHKLLWIQNDFISRHYQTEPSLAMMSA